MIRWNKIIPMFFPLSLSQNILWGCTHPSYDDDITDDSDQD